MPTFASDSVFIEKCKKVAYVTEQSAISEFQEWFFRCETVKRIHRAKCRRFRFFDKHLEFDLLANAAMKFFLRLQNSEVVSPIGLLSTIMFRCAVNLKASERLRLDRENSLEVTLRHEDDNSLHAPDPGQNSLYDGMVDDRFVSVSQSDFADALCRLGEVNELYPAIVLLRLTGETYAEAGKVLNLSKVAAYELHQRAKMNLKNILVRTCG